MVVAQKVRAAGGNHTVKIDLRAAGNLIALALTVFSNGVAAIGLGPAQLRSGLGEPLSLSLPVTLQSGEEVGCVQAKPHGDELPTVFNTRAAVVQVRGQTRVEISSAQPVNEPAVGLIVTAGCASPVARDYVLFLDPPLAPAAALVRVVAADANAAARPKTPPTARADRNVRSDTRRNAGRRAASRRDNSTVPQGKDSAAASAPPRTGRPTASVAARAPSRETLPRKMPEPVAGAAARISDRLTVAPVDEPRAGSGRAEQPGSAGAPAGVDVATSPATSPAAAPTPAPAPAQSATASSAATANLLPNAAGDQAARDEDQKRLQRELQLQIKVLGDQILALRSETAALNTRNQALADTAFPKFLGWIFALLALLALALAAWIAWRYSRLRRAVAGDHWWGNSVFGASAAGAPREQAASDPAPAARIPVPPASGKTASPASAMHVSDHPAASIPGVSERVKPSVRSSGKHYSAALESDFTVSDIEAAMATVRTVPPPRAPSAASLSDSDFSPLGGPSLPSPFTDPPPPQSPAGKQEESGHLDFRLDISPPPVAVGTTVPVDPLAITSHQITEVDPPQAIDFELPLAPSALDFELPAARGAGGASSGTAGSDDADDRMRHAASLLDDIFPPPGVDTILRLDDPGADSMTSTEVQAHEREAGQASLKLRLARFADLIDQVDEIASTDPLRAIAQLRQHVLRDELIPSLMWLRLFELYRRVDKKTVYEALTEHFARRYHRPMVKWDETLADRTPQVGLSALPEIDRNIEAQWGTEFGLDLLRSLLCDRDQPDAVVFNAVLQRDLLEAAKVFPLADHQVSNLRHNP